MPRSTAVVGGEEDLAARLVRVRLRSQCITHPAATPALAVQGLCALQAQDYAWGLWAIGLRTAPQLGAAATQQAVEAALAQAALVRTWPMRRTLHIVAAADVRWMLELMASKAVAEAATRRRELGIEEAHVDRAGEVWAAARFGVAGAIKPCAIKVIRPALAGDEQYRRLFVAEGRVAMMLGHANIVSVFDVGVVDELLFMAMRCV